MVSVGIFMDMEILTVILAWNTWVGNQLSEHILMWYAADGHKLVFLNPETS